ncbi:MAG: hypothetical protein R2824_13765 [Saprospiraceae bacterium]|nr:hypothetical protein [Lewinella sp.]
MRLLLLAIACLSTLGAAMAQEFKDEATFTVDASKYDRFHLYNRRGAVTVKAANGNTATLKVNRRLKAKTKERLEEAKAQMYMDKMEKDGDIVFFIQHPKLKLKFGDDGFAWYSSEDENGWGWNSDDERIEAEYTITLEIPANTDLTVTTHEHPLKVSGMQGDLIARNHHGGVLVEGQGGSADVHSHHKDIEIFYTKNPTRECSYDTHHGDIRVHYPANLSADATMYSYHGEFFTEFDWNVQPMTVSTESREKGKGTKYMISGKSGTNVRIGRGGPVQHFKSHHGDIYLLKN